MTGPLPHLSACAEFDRTEVARSISRRRALRTAIGAAAGLAVATTVGDAFIETSYAATGHADRILVVLSMRGAADGLSLMVPFGDPVYYQARPSIAVPAGQLLVPDSFFGLHPALAPLLPLWNQGTMAAIHATGQLVTTRSHFAAMEEVEDADPGSSARVGWLNRLVSLRNDPPAPHTAIQLGTTVLATQLAGPSPAMAAPELSGLKLAGPGGAGAAAWRTALAASWANAPAVIGAGASQALAAAQTFAPIAAAPSSAVSYPSGDLGKALRETAKVLKADVGAEVVTVDQGSWDHHQWVGDLDDGNLKRMATPFAAALAAFFADLGPVADKVTVVTISEFGRRVKENANGGLDHGHGNVMFVLGAGVRGGYYGQWPGIENAVDADLPVTTDYRDVLAEVVGAAFPERSLSGVFPGLSHRATGFMANNPPPTTSPVVPPSQLPSQPPTQPPTQPSTQPATPSTDPTGGPTAGPLPALPTGLIKSYGAKRGRARVGAAVTAPRPVLTARGKSIGLTTDVRWETVVDGKTRRHGNKRRTTVKRGWRGSRLQARMTYHAPGYAPSERVFSWGTVRG